MVSGIIEGEVALSRGDAETSGARSSTCSRAGELEGVLPVLGMVIGVDMMLVDARFRAYSLLTVD